MFGGEVPAGFLDDRYQQRVHWALVSCRGEQQVGVEGHAHCGYEPSRASTRARSASAWSSSSPARGGRSSPACSNRPRLLQTGGCCRHARPSFRTARCFARRWWSEDTTAPRAPKARDATAQGEALGPGDNQRQRPEGPQLSRNQDAFPISAVERAELGGASPRHDDPEAGSSWAEVKRRRAWWDHTTSTVAAIPGALAMRASQVRSGAWSNSARAT